ncbi:MAG: hypothetical protein AVDCRST_MAG38-1423, partial [uncultured Solirubrobacteraceae bacterium]
EDTGADARADRLRIAAQLPRRPAGGRRSPRRLARDQRVQARILGVGPRRGDRRGRGGAGGDGGAARGGGRRRGRPGRRERARPGASGRARHLPRRSHRHRPASRWSARLSRGRRHRGPRVAHRGARHLARSRPDL